MIEVNVQQGGITITGHAEYAEHGKDIVCASVSILFLNLVKSIEDLTEDKISYEVIPGAANIKHGNLSEKSRTLVDSFFVGVCMIAEECPDYVRIV